MARPWTLSVHRKAAVNGRVKDGRSSQKTRRSLVSWKRVYRVKHLRGQPPGASLQPALTPSLSNFDFFVELEFRGRGCVVATDVRDVNVASER